MAILWPTEPDFGRNTAEEVLWRALAEQLPEDATLLHSVNLLEESTEREIDLLVLWPGVGIAAIEVKGGTVWHNEQGWHQGSATDSHRMNPVRQVQDARHVLQEKLRRRGVGAGQARTAHLVAFPHTRFAQDFETSDCPRSMIIDRDDVAGVAAGVHRAIVTHGQGVRGLDEVDARDLYDVLAGQLGTQVDVLGDARAELDRLDLLTQEQVGILRVVAGHQRFQVVGGAGCGKTWLALEQARRRARAGERVALLCYSRGLGRYLQRVTNTWPRGQRPAYVGLFHDLPLGWGAETGTDDDADYWERRLPLELADLATRQPPSELFDSVVVDEAQDFGDLWWTSLLRCLKDPARGGLFLFGDAGQRVFARDGASPIDLPPFELDENVRSTKPIAQLSGSVSERRITPRGGAGAPVRLIDVPAEDAVEAADDAVEALLEEGWDPGDVALLTTRTRHPEQVNRIAAVGHDAYWDDFFDGTDVFYGHVLNFKGLERPVVVLAANGFRDSERARSMLYTGLSRARSLLVVAGPRAEIERIGGEAARRRLGDAEAWAPPG
ncbi:nuclease-related domain-containing DEAD/DEAH box helicase [Occultella kanbiaonis]|uniref:nuclease-related domain-containing DEAD/DEAH box helicase n=1 Tax=Occultella kanbiaonis TaxID=2675754 RepID=UPI0013D7DC3F|nr:NERD domain-containing protein [Occultella kanbiaonis]